jgi:hypothetical protein
MTSIEREMYNHLHRLKDEGRRQWFSGWVTWFGWVNVRKVFTLVGLQSELRRMGANRMFLWRVARDYNKYEATP